MDRTVIREALMNHDPYDQFAWVQGWRFSVSQYLTDQGEHVSEFRGGGADDIREDFEYEMLADIQPSIEALKYADKILGRFRAWLALAGKDY